MQIQKNLEDFEREFIFIDAFNTFADKGNCLDLLKLITDDYHYNNIVRMVEHEVNKYLQSLNEKDKYIVQETMNKVILSNNIEFSCIKLGLDSPNISWT